MPIQNAGAGAPVFRIMENSRYCDCRGRDCAVQQIMRRIPLFDDT